MELYIQQKSTSEVPFPTQVLCGCLTSSMLCLIVTVFIMPISPPSFVQNLVRIAESNDFNHYPANNLAWKCVTRFCHEPWPDCSLGSSFSWVHIVCKYMLHKKINWWKRRQQNCDWRENDKTYWLKWQNAYAMLNVVKLFSNHMTLVYPRYHSFW